jgi:hypothetical protein
MDTRLQFFTTQMEGYTHPLSANEKTRYVSNF